VSPQADDLVPYAAVLCRGDSVPGQPRCGQVKINEAEYSRQMDRPDSFWMCPHCGSTADFDDEFFETLHEINEEEHDPPLEVCIEDAVRIYGTQAIREALDKIEAEAARG
jgi:hypothetical protein